MRLSYRAEVRPTPRQRAALLQHAGNARYAYNWGLRQHRRAYEKWVSEGKPKKWKGWLNAISLHRDLNVLKKLPVEDGGIPWMYEASKAAPQEALRDLDRAFKNFLSGRARYPRFKSRSRGIGGFRLTGAIKVDQRRIQLPKIGKVKFQPGERDYLPWGKHAQVSVTEQAGRWFVSVVGPEAAEAAPNGREAVGLDLGVARLATLSDGTVIENPKALAQGQKKIKKLQQEVSRKKKGSKNRKKAVRILRKAHSRVRNIRRDALHKVTTTIAKSHGKVVIEDLKVRNMTAGGGSRKRGLNRVVLDAAFGEFRRLLDILVGIRYITYYGYQQRRTAAAEGSCSEEGKTEVRPRIQTPESGISQRVPQAESRTHPSLGQGVPRRQRRPPQKAAGCLLRRTSRSETGAVRRVGETARSSRGQGRIRQTVPC